MTTGGLATAEWGRRDAPPLVLLHGFMGSAVDWKEVAAILSHAFRVVAVDLPGHGASTDPTERNFSLDGAADAVVAATAGLERFALVGYSLGGRVAYHVAIARPDRVTSLVAASAHPGLADDGDRLARRRLDEQRAGRLLEDPRRFLDRWYRAPMFGGLATNPDLRERLAARRLAGMRPTWARALVGLSTGRQAPIGERLRSTGVPTLLVAGTQDERYLALLGTLAGEAGAWYYVIPGAGHALHMERPETFASVIRSFTRRTN